jgi:hypothetical protein
VQKRAGVFVTNQPSDLNHLFHTNEISRTSLLFLEIYNLKQNNATLRACGRSFAVEMKRTDATEQDAIFPLLLHHQVVFKVTSPENFYF